MSALSATNTQHHFHRTASIGVNGHRSFALYFYNGKLSRETEGAVSILGSAAGQTGSTTGHE